MNHETIYNKGLAMVKKDSEKDLDKKDLEEILERMKITHVYVFALVFREEAVVRAFLTPLLGESVDSVLFQKIDPENDVSDSSLAPDVMKGVSIEAEKTVLGELLSKSARFDIFVTTNMFAADIEMQAYKNEDEPLNKRARAYQRAIDQELIRIGAHYKDIRSAFAIFICTYDPFDQGLAQYTFENYCTENKDLPLDDGTVKIFLYTKGNYDNVHPEIAAFLRYCNNSPPTGALATLVDQKVQEIKNDAKHRESFMTFEMIIKAREQIARKEGLKEGLKEGQQNSVRSLLKKGKSIQEIASLLDFSEEYVEDVIRNFKQAQA